VGLTLLANKVEQEEQAGNQKRKGPENEQNEQGEPTYSDAAVKINVEKKSAEQSINKEESGILISGLLTRESRRT
jgi:hypothetical protein